MEDGFGRKLPPAAWLLALLLVAFGAGAVSGAVVSLILDDSGDGGAPAQAFESRLPSLEGDAVARTAVNALPAVVTVINELPPRPGSAGGLAGGAGVIVDERGFVLTNEHIVHDPGKLTVLLNDGQTRPATVVSHDAPFTDLAVLRIPSGGLKSLPFGDSDELAPGETVVAIGSPDIDYQNTVTVGVASGLHRRKRMMGVWIDDLIQTDAAINAGNSGGPLLNLRGQIVGLISLRDIGADDPLFGIAFALSSNRIRPIVASIVDKGQFPRPYFGIEHQDVDANLIRQANLRVDRGALVRSVFDGSPAQKAGIRSGDVILSIGRVDIDEDASFINALEQLGTSDRVPVQVYRDGRVGELSLEITPR